MSAWSSNAWFSTAWYSGAWSSTGAVPATTAGGGRRRYTSRALAYEPVRKKWRKLDELKEEIALEAQELVKKEQISIDEARKKARQLLLLGKVVERAKVLETELTEILKSDTHKVIAKRREILDNQSALLAILLASTEV